MVLMMKAFSLILLVSAVANTSLCFKVHDGELLHEDGFCCSGSSCTTKCRDALEGAPVVSGELRYVYRADFRLPKDVFSNGFKCLGKNDNLLEHTGGISTHYGPKHNSLFVSTSSEQAKAEQWAKTIMENSRKPGSKAQKYAKNPSIFLYKIRADWNYFSMKESLMQAFKATENKEYKDHADGVAGKYSEWEACGGVKPEEIESATEYVWGKLNEPKPALNNDKYASKDTKGSANVYIPTAYRR